MKRKDSNTAGERNPEFVNIEWVAFLVGGAQIEMLTSRIYLNHTRTIV